MLSVTSRFFLSFDLIRQHSCVSVFISPSIRSLTGAAYREHSTPLFAALRIIKLEDIYVQEVSKFMYLYNHNNLPEQLSHIFTYTINIHAHNTRIIQHIRPIRGRTSLSLNSVLYKGPLIWNSITAETKEKRHVHCFIR